MTKSQKIIDKMRNNPHDWRIDDLEVIANRFGITMRKGRGSHVSFSHPKWIEILTVPVHNVVKPVYVKKFLMLIDLLRGQDE